MTISDEIDQLVDLTCPRCGFEHTAPSRIKLLEYIRALERVMDAADELCKSSFIDSSGYRCAYEEDIESLIQALAAAREAGK